MFWKVKLIFNNMACLVRKRGKLYRKVRLDIWGYYKTYYNKYSKYEKSRNKGDNTLKYWLRFKRLVRRFRDFKRKRYVYRLWNRERFKFPKRLKKNYIKPRFLRNFYLVLKKRNFIKYIKLSQKGKLVRGFVSTYLGYLESRLFVIIYRLNIINNIFIIKNVINLGVFFINCKKKKHINTRMKLGDFLHVAKPWKNILKQDMLLRLNQKIVIRNITNFYINFDKFFFLFYKLYKYKDIRYPIRIDLYRAIDFIGPLR